MLTSAYIGGLRQGSGRGAVCPWRSASIAWLIGKTRAFDHRHQIGADADISHGQAVADAEFGQQEVRVGRIPLDLLAQLANENT